MDMKRLKKKVKDRRKGINLNNPCKAKYCHWEVDANSLNDVIMLSKRNVENFLICGS